jgi:DNA-directed RNA polymerase subunit L
MYYTTDNWLTASAALGHFRFWNPRTQLIEDGYGVIAKQLVGDLILGQNLGIYNSDGSVTIDENGFILTTEHEDNSKVFTIRRHNDDDSYTNILTIDDHGNLVLDAYDTSEEVNTKISVYDGTIKTYIGDYYSEKEDTVADVDVEYISWDYYDDQHAPPQDAVGWATTSPAWEYGKYIWQRTKTTDGNGTVSYSTPVCIQGSAATVYSVISSDTVVVLQEDGTYKPASITFTGLKQVGNSSSGNYAGRFVIQTTTDNSSWTTQYTSASNESSKTYTVPSGVTAVRCSLYLAGGTVTLLDTQTVPVVTDGATGEDAYTVILTNENHTFAGDESAALPANVDCEVVAYKGATPVDATIGTITGAPNGMNVTVSYNGTTSAKFNVAVTSSMTTKNGTLSVPVTLFYGTANAKTFNMIFTYSLAIKGVDGEDSTSYHLIVSHAAVAKGESGAYYPDTITISAKSQTGENNMDDYSGRFKIETTADGTSWTTQYTSSANESSKVFTVPADIESIRCSLYKAGGTAVLLDQQSVPIVLDGENAYTVILTNENHTFAAGVSAAIQSNVNCSVIAYNGATPVVVHIGTITGAPTGMTPTIVANTNDTTNATFNVAVDTTMTTRNGTLTIPVTLFYGTANAKTFNMIFTYSLAIKGEDGLAGYNSMIVYLYQRAASVPSAPSGTLTYTFSTGTLSGTLGNWSQTIPSGSSPVYVIAATATSRTDTDTIDSNEWSSAVILAQNGVNGDDGLNSATIFLYQRAASTPSKPSGSLTYTFATGALSGTLGNWTQEIPTVNGNPCYVIQATAVSTGATDTIASSEWSEVSKLVEDGSDGTNGYNTAVVYLYQRATSAPPNPSSTLTYTFSTGVLTGTLGNWTQTIPSGTDPVYVIAATATSRTDTDTIASNEWSTAVVLAQNGNDGSNGNDGLNSATVFLYQRAASTPSAPSGNITYRFSDGVITSGTLGNWTRTIPTTDGNPCYVIQATAASADATDTIAPSEWSSATKLVEDGEHGSNGYNTAVVYLYQRATSAPSAPSGTLTYTFSTGVLSGTLGDWTQTIPSGTDPIYVIAATAHATTSTDTIASNEWTSAVVLAQNGVDGTNGTNGTNGLNVATVFLYQRAASTPSAIAGAIVYRFSDGEITSGTLGNWSRTIPATDGNPCYAIQATASSTDSTDRISPTEWSTVVKLVEDGEDGSDGKGISSIVEQYYLSTSNTSCTGGSWSTTPWEWVSGKYIWTRSMITWSDSTTTYTTAVLAKDMNGINEKLVNEYSTTTQTKELLSSEVHRITYGPTVTASANKSPYPYTKTSSASNAYFEVTDNEDGTYTVKKLTSSSAELYMSASCSLAAGQYTYTFIIDGTDTGGTAWVRLTGGGTTSYQTMTKTTSGGKTYYTKTLTATSTVTAVLVDITYVAPENWVGNLAIMINSGSTSKAFESPVGAKMAIESVYSLIEQTADGILIKADKVNISGFLTVSDVSSSGTVEIYGGRIKGGTITLGGSNNGNGQLTVVNSSNQTLLSADNSAFTYYCRSSTASFSIKNGSSNTLLEANQNGLTVYCRTTSAGLYLKDSSNGINLYKGTIQGPTIIVGGSNNANGLISVRDANGTSVVQLNNNGLSVQKGTIQGPNIIAGGSNNTNGTITVKNASSTTISTLDKDGISTTSLTASSYVNFNCSSSSYFKIPFYSGIVIIQWFYHIFI